MGKNVIAKWSIVIAGILAGYGIVTAVPAQESVASQIEVPRSGSPIDRTRAVWISIKPVLLEDAKTNLSDKEYWARIEPLHSAWSQLQYEIAEESSLPLTTFHTKVWMLLGDLYGAQGIKAAYQQKVREKTKKKIDTSIAELDEMLAEIH